MLLASFDSILHKAPHVDLAGDGGEDEDGAVFLQSVDGLLNLGDEGVKLCRFAIEERGDGSLFIDRW